MAEFFSEPNFTELLTAHWLEAEPYREICAPAPDVAEYLALDEAGRYRMWAARDSFGTLAGYAGFFVRPHTHYREMRQATMDLFALAPPHRGHLYTMLAGATRELRRLGVNRVLMGDRPPGHLAKVYARLGYQPLEQIYACVL